MGKVFKVRETKLYVEDFQNLEFLEVCLNGNFPTHQNPDGRLPVDYDFWKSLVIEVQEKFRVKVTGLGGPFPDTEIHQEVMLVFYEKITMKH